MTFIFEEIIIMEISLIPRYTYEDYARWQEDWELIKGYPYQMLPSATWRHNIAQRIYQYKRK